jgi:PAS domain-containing protein
MEHRNWIKSFPAAIVVCDERGMIVEMNDQAAESFQKEGGERLIGTNVLDCHPEPSRSKLSEMLTNRTANIYTLEKGGLKKFVYQVPWFQEGKYAGFVELSIPIPFEMPHFVREG